MPLRIARALLVLGNSFGGTHAAFQIDPRQGQPITACSQAPSVTGTRSSNGILFQGGPHVPGTRPTSTSISASHTCQPSHVTSSFLIHTNLLLQLPEKSLQRQPANKTKIFNVSQSLVPQCPFQGDTVWDKGKRKTSTGFILHGRIDL